jgi:3-hydroxybutyrate dehydrogenase
MRMKDQTAIVTGAASGIGRGIALAFAREGARVCIADLDGTGAEAVAGEIRKAGGEAIAVAMDVSREADVEAGVDRASRELGGVHVLVSNAGVQIISPVHELEFEKWKRLLAIHLDGAFLTTKACLKRMYAQGQGGAILYMGSVHSKLASLLKAPYVTAKHGLIGLCRVVAKEGAAHGVRANVICPGFVRTPLVDKQIPEQARELGMSEDEVIRKVMLKDTVDGEFTTLDDVAQAAVFLAAHPTNAFTGQSLIVSHGWCME